jgi:hypothetical protein
MTKEVKMLESYKAIAHHVSTKYGVTRASETVRCWKHRHGLPVETRRQRVRISVEALESWYELHFGIA